MTLKEYCKRLVEIVKGNFFYFFTMIVFIFCVVVSDEKRQDKRENQDKVVELFHPLGDSSRIKCNFE